MAQITLFTDILPEEQELGLLGILNGLILTKTMLII